MKSKYLFEEVSKVVHNIGHKPDALIPNRLFNIFIGKIENLGNDIYDAKLTNFIGANGQAYSFIKYISETKGGKLGLGSIWYIGAAGTRVSGSVLRATESLGVNIFQTAAYRDPNNPALIHLAQWVGVSNTMGSLKYNLLYGPSSPSNTGPWIGEFTQQSPF